ncbi:DNA alkylation repair protein [Pontibacter sp. JAM-7]|uniref:DNA alkylation repair protein n=1 Tax=Pontibacter sp. JAM-7 TaxID=3366581 RepID=UPI003AF86625
MAEPLKDLYSPEFVTQLAGRVQAVFPAFTVDAFSHAVLSEGWDDLALKARMRHITQCLRHHLPPDYADAVAILNQVAPHFSGYPAVIFPDFIQCYGLQDWDTSMAALHWMTRFSTAEFAVRPFLQQDQTRMLAIMQDWCDDENEHVRRLASEGCRPRLPWAAELKDLRQNPEPLLPILDQLKQDTSLYVRRSVANNLNDITKDHPDLVLCWCRARLDQHQDTDWLLRHACRTLLKQADVRALRLFDLQDASHVAVVDLQLSSERLSIGDTLEFSFQLATEQAELGQLRVEYLIDYMKANGRRRAKAFQVRSKHFADNQTTITCRQSFRQMSTRRHYPGLHNVRIRVNGLELASTEFTLVAAP